MDEKKRVLHELCDTLSRALKDANEKIHSAGGKLGAGDLDYLDKLTHSIKSIKTTLAMMDSEDEDGYSQRYVSPIWEGMQEMTDTPMASALRR